MSEPIQHPVSKLGFFIEYTSTWLIEVREAAAHLEQARHRPYALTDDDVDRVRRVYAEQADDLTLFEDTATRWAAQTALTAEQRTGLATLESNLAQLGQLNASVQELSRYLAERTINRVLETPDLELGLNTLLNQMTSETSNSKTNPPL
jgi:hypothetical protein